MTSSFLCLRLGKSLPFEIYSPLPLRQILPAHSLQQHEAMLRWPSLPVSCLSCNETAEHDSIPFCNFCIESLVSFPGPVLGLCEEDPVSSWHSLYLAVGRGYDVLRAWKKNPSPLADRRILRPHSKSLEALRKIGAQFIAPIPQGATRSWRLGRSPARQLCQKFSSWLALPTCDLLEIMPGIRPQASLPLQDRLERRSPFRINPRSQALLPGGRILLVDDFVTSGRTVRGAASLLRRAGAKDVHVVCLGMRPRRSHQSR